MKTYEDIFSNLNNILVVTAHPDDLDFSFGGLIARLKRDKKTVKVVLATNGANGGRAEDNSAILGQERIQEQMEAMEILGMSKEDLRVLNYLDGELDPYDDSLMKQITKYIRLFKPEIICTHHPSIIYDYSKKLDGYFINHRDHRAVGTVVFDAVYPFSRNPAFFADQKDSHTVTKLLVSYDQISNPNVKIDISDVIELKKRAMLCHKSQFSKEEVDQLLSEENQENNKFFEFSEFINLLA
jgi:LmbE family N-acetylglucosaminyl deacetylase